MIISEQDAREAYRDWKRCDEAWKAAEETAARARNASREAWVRLEETLGFAETTGAVAIAIDGESLLFARRHLREELTLTHVSIYPDKE